MTAAGLFSAANTFALLGWLILLFAGRLRWAANLVTGFAMPLMLAGLYSLLIAGHWSDPGGGGFGSLSAVGQLFANPWKLLAGWVHYLAFDLFVGSWEVRDAQKHGVPHWMLAPALLLTFLFGPAGLLLYFATREAFTRIAKPQPDRAGQP